MKSNQLRLLLIALFALVPACHDTGDITKPPDPVPVGAMTYTGYDETGTPLVNGWVKLDIPIIAADPTIPSNVAGTWELRLVSPAGEIGPQVGRGSLEGLLQNEQLFVNFNPQNADDNVVGDGVFTVIGGPASGTQWEGTWIWSDISGPRRTGTFRARS
jgi:hypothetical protein